MIGAAVGTMFIHVFMVRVIVPLFDKEHDVGTTTYQQLAATQPENWFSNNPVHCLRSKYIYQHSPPCIYNARGKGHLIEPNPEIGIFFCDTHRAASAEYDEDNAASTAVKTLKRLSSKA